MSWSQVSGPGAAWFGNVNQPNTTATFPGVGTYVLRLTASDSVLQAGDDLTVTIQRSPSPVTFIAKGSTWKYLDDGSDQGTAWTSRTFTDGGWVSGAAPLGYGIANDGPQQQLPTTTVGYGPDPNNKYVTTYFRRAFTVSNPASVTNLMVSVQRDDGAVVYLNGTEIFRSNIPAGPVDYLTPAIGAVGGVDEVTFYSQPADPSLLVAGNNVVAVEIHQANGTSSDIILDLELSGSAFPPNQGPLANAGTDQTITLPANATLNGTVNDDGLPIPPGLLSFGWSKFSGPGAVTFGNPNALSTTASFSTNGTYVLRLTAGDGSLSASDDLTVTANGQVQQPLVIDSVDLRGGTPSILSIRFIATAGLTYTVQFRDSLNTVGWSKLMDVPAQSVTQTVEVTDPATTNSSRYYRILTPQQP
jgi:hypothetical protein